MEMDPLLAVADILLAYQALLIYEPPPQVLHRLGNAIRALNRHSVQVGHIDRATAVILAPLLDSHLLAAAHGIIPKPPKNARSAFRLPCQVHFFTRQAAAALVGAAITAADLDLIHADHPEFALSESAIVQEQTKNSHRDVDKLFALVRKDGKARIEPMEVPGDVVVSDLFEHQKEALGWLVHREESCDLPPFWEEDKDGGFENVLTKQKRNERPPPLKGGFFADDMGLGKTLTLLSLIGRSKARSVGGKKARGAKRRKVEGAEESRTTLVVYRRRCSHLGTLGQEFGQEGSPVNEIEWFRVILDESHVLKNSECRKTSLLGAISLRRTKETDIGSKSLVSIPPKIVVAYYIELSAEEREYYDQMELEGKNKMQEVGDRDSILCKYSTVLYFILRLRQLCNDVALCPLDMKSWFPACSLEDVSNNPELLKKLASLAADGDDFDCPICLFPPTKTVITSCAHIYCQTCIMKIINSSSSRCPICRRSLSKEDIFIAPEVKHPHEDVSGNLSSDKPLSSKAAGAGVNLTAASTVYLFDPWWNPGVEEQAMDRVHLIVKCSIEERMLELQEKKRRLISGAFGRKKRGKNDKEIRVEELQMMLGLK
ncbi:hypothetical protein GUJ93_ZPchr0073g2816 [Zizania palustris]|uniref:RING-type domain-containing protein n=1 Tax=Zizania palustris TaxID=103762 RepID=A0A8J5R8W0_ZIZPA|nr:hypothetical protein GUJ93_ZPchr0073g2816 [Zizania palustris]